MTSQLLAQGVLLLTQRTVQIPATAHRCRSFGGRVTQGGCPPRVPTDPYVHTLVHTVPQSIASLRATD